MPLRKAKSLVPYGRKLCRSLMDAVNDVILIFDHGTLQILDANKRALEVHGYPRRAMLRRRMPDLTHDVPNYSELIGASKRIERTHFNHAGKKIPFLVSLSLIDFWGRKAVLSINCDIGERKQIEAAIAANERRLRSLLRGISEIIALIDAGGGIRFVSPQVERVLEIPAKNAVGKNVFDFIHPEDRERAAAEYAKTVESPGESLPSVLRLRNQAGQWIPFEIIANNQLHDPDVAGVIFTGHDLRFRGEAEATIRELNADFDRRVEERTLDLAKANASLRVENQQRRHTESQLKQSLSLLHATLESTADGILVVSREGIITSCNQKFLEMWRIPQMAVAGLRDQELLSLAVPQAQDARAFEQGVKFLYGNPDAVSFDTVRLKDGRIFHRYTQPQRVGEEIVGRVWSFRDITQTQRLQGELHQAKKMEAIGRLAGGVAHDFNNLLMLISGYAGQVLADPALPDKHRDSCTQLMEAIQRAASLTRQLLAFSRKQPVTAQLLDLNALTAGMEKMLSRLLKDRVHLVFHLKAGSLPLYADPSQIELMIMNMALNARDAMPEGGVLTIRTGSKELGIRPGSESKPAQVQFAYLEVADTGHGMAAEIQEHIFEPFFTTKEIGQGTGLGLATAYGIVEQAGGHISVESEPDRGTTFRVFLPLAAGIRPSAKRAASSALEETRQAGAMPTETILLVEDEAGIRSMTRTFLEKEGYTVLEAADGDEAIRVAREHPGAIALVLTDIIMPGMRGDELVRAIRQERPSANAIYITGYADAHKLDARVPVVEKPFAFPDLAKRVREVLDQAKRNEPPSKKIA